MGRPITDDMNGKMLDAESDKLYGVEFTTKFVNQKDGSTRYLHSKLDVGHDSFVTLSKLFPKEKLKWVYWNTFSEEEQKRTKRKGEWLQHNGAI